MLRSVLYSLHSKTLATYSFLIFPELAVTVLHTYFGKCFLSTSLKLDPTPTHTFFHSTVLLP